MAACPSCGRELPGEFPFCPFCGAALSVEAPAREERKVVTVVFCDLVGSTARAERLDPEDVRALLSNYHTRVREQLERFGGTVEKFIGDAVVAFFGAPVAHEDDPERAVRAAFAIREWAMDEPDLHVRIAVNTGEALVAVGAQPKEGEGIVSGDVVNTAARLQSAAPVDGILVGEQTFRATERAIAYRIAEPVVAKGKAEPVAAWEALEARSRFGVDVARRSAAPLVGRDREVELLVAALERAVGERTPQLVTLVGVPGIGKSRLLAELFQAIERDQRLVTWRQGRSLPYGEGVSFWAVGEMVKAQAGVLETDTEAEAADKLVAAVGRLLPDETEARWVTAHVRPLAGLAGEDGGGGGTADRRGEAFAAWRRFFEALAEQRPLVLVFEDLHWADDGLLDFVDQMADRLADIPVLLVATARPELLARRPSWGGGKANAVTLSLAPLSDDETARLVHALLERSVLPAEVQTALLERAGGNPLYAEEFVRMTSERGSDDLELPESVQGIIAARVDALDPDDKQLLQDAAVVGKVFWSGALAAIIGRDRFELEERLYELERRELVRRERRSSVAGESEYAFRHVLLRDVAYGSIPRAARVERHRLAAVWVESLGRPDDHADLLTHHYLAAIELARAAGVDSSAFAAPAAAALLRAADRSLALNAFPAAARMYEEAIALGLADEDRPRAVFRRGLALNVLGDPARVAVLEEARSLYEAAGYDDAAGEASAMLAEALWYSGRTKEFRAALSRAQELVEGHEASAAVARVRAQTARYAMLDDKNEEAVRVGREALDMAERLGLDELRANVLSTIGTAMSNEEPGSGDEMLREAVAIGTTLNSVEAPRALNNLAVSVFFQGSIRREHELLLESRAAAERLGSDNFVRFAEGNLCWTAYAIGDWNDSLSRCDAFIAECEAGSAHASESLAQDARAEILLGRDDLDRALRAWTRTTELDGGGEGRRAAVRAQLLAARMLHELGRLDDARAALLTALGKTDRKIYTPQTISLVLLAEPLGLSDRLGEFLGRVGSGPWLEMARLVVAGEHAEAARRVDEAGYLSLAAQVRLRSQDDGELGKAIDFFASVGATRYLTRAEAQLAAMA
jgi:class 3 adenylate cyclase/tetratricopeptide (TPR) repeat protein